MIINEYVLNILGVPTKEGLHPSSIRRLSELASSDPFDSVVPYCHKKNGMTFICMIPDMVMQLPGFYEENLEDYLFIPSNPGDRYIKTSCFYASSNTKIYVRVTNSLDTLVENNKDLMNRLLSAGLSVFDAQTAYHAIMVSKV